MQNADYLYFKNRIDKVINECGDKKDVIVYYDKDNVEHNISYGEFGNELKRFGKTLESLQLKRADRVAVIW